MVDIFTYSDFRQYLKDVFSEMKGAQKSFSHRAFAKRAGFSSSNYVMLVMQGKRNLSGEGIQKVSKALKHGKREAEFFENLVRFGQATSDAERNLYYGRIAANKKYAEAKRLEKGKFEYYSKWFIPVIREMVLMKDFSESPEWIASELAGSITPKEARSAIDFLLDLELLVRDSAGKLVQKDRHIASGDEIASLAMTNFQREMIERAAKSIDETKEDSREIGSVTFAISREKLDQAKKMIREFRSKLSGFLAEEESAEDVYQFNVQLFNLTKVEEGKK